MAEPGRSGRRIRPHFADAEIRSERQVVSSEQFRERAAAGPLSAGVRDSPSLREQRHPQGALRNVRYSVS